MIAKCVPRKTESMPRVVGYCAKEEKGYVLDSSVGYTKKEIKEAFQSCLPDKMGVKNVNAVVHCVLRLAPKETLSDEKFTELAKDYREKMLFGERDYACFRHNDIKDGEHVHLIVSYYDKDGRRWDDSFFKKRSEEVRKELEIKYGLQLVGHSENNKRKKESVNYKDFASELHRNTLSARSYTQQQIKGALWGKKNISLTDFVKELNKRNIEVNFNLQNDNSKISGVTFKLRTDYNDYTFKGSQVSKYYSFVNLEKKLSIGKEDIAFASALKKFENQDTESSKIISKNTNQLKNEILAFAAENNVVIGRKAIKVFENSRLNNNNIVKVDLYLDNCKKNPQKVVKLVDFINSEHVRNHEKSIDRFLLEIEKKDGVKGLKHEKAAILKVFDAHYFDQNCNYALKSCESFRRSGFSNAYKDIKLSDQIESTVERRKGYFSRQFNEKIAELYPTFSSERVRNLILTDSEKSSFSRQIEEGRGDDKFLKSVIEKNNLFVLEKLYTKLEFASVKGLCDFSKENFGKIETLAKQSMFSPSIMNVPLEKLVEMPSFVSKGLPVSPMRLDNFNDFENTSAFEKLLDSMIQTSGAGSLSSADDENIEVKKRKRNHRR